MFGDREPSSPEGKGLECNLVWEYKFCYSTKLLGNCAVRSFANCNGTVKGRSGKSIGFGPAGENYEKPIRI